MAACFSKKLDGKTVNVATGKGTSIGQLAKMVKSLAGSKSRIVAKPKRNAEVENFIGTSRIIKRKAIGLREGLKMMLGKGA